MFVELIEFYGECNIQCNHPVFNAKGQLKIELIKSNIIKHGDYNLFTNTIANHFDFDPYKFYISSIQNEYDNNGFKLTDKPLLNYIKPNNTYFITIHPYNTKNKSITLIPINSLPKYQHCGPLIIHHKYNYTRCNLMRVLHGHFKYDLWEEIILKNNNDINDDQETLKFTDQLVLTLNDDNIYKNNKHILFMKISNLPKYRAMHYEQIYHFKYSRIYRPISLTQTEIDQHKNNYKAFKKYLKKQIIARYSHNPKVKANLKKRCKDLEIYALNPDYSDIARYKYPRQSVGKKRQLKEDYLLPMYYKNDKPIKEIKQFKPHKCYWMFMIGFWSHIEINQARDTMYK